MNDRTNLQVVKHKAFPVDPSEAGKKGVRKREQNVMDDLTSTRQYVNTLSMPAAQYLGAVVQEETLVKPDANRIAAARDILDRTIGKAAQELRIGPAEENLNILRELDAAE